MPRAYSYTAPARAAGSAVNQSVFASPEEEESLLRMAKRGSLSGIAKVGNLLDVPSSMVRDVSTWLPGGVRPQNPFDQLLSPLSPENRVTGREMLRRNKLIKSRNTAGNFLGGLGVEMLMDPTLPFSFGSRAVGAGGKVAKAANLMDVAPVVAAKKLGRKLGSVGPREARIATTLDDLMKHSPQSAAAVTDAATKYGYKVADIANEPLGGLVGAGMPFRDPLAVLGKGKLGQSVARGLDKFSLNPFEIGDFWRGTIPGTNKAPIGALYRMMDHTINEAQSPLGRELGRQTFKAESGAIADAKLPLSPYIKGLDEAGWMSPDKAQQLRYLQETPAHLRPAGLPAEVMDYLDYHDAVLPKMPLEAADIGAPLKAYSDPAIEAGLAQYSPRHMDLGPGQGAGAEFERAYTVFDPHQIKRKSHLRGYGGYVGPDYMAPSQVIDNIAAHPQINTMLDAGMKNKDIADEIDNLFGTAIQDPKAAEKAAAFLRRNPLATPQEIADAAKSGKQKHISGLVGFLKKLDPDRRASGIFDTHPVTDFQNRVVSHNLSQVNGKAVLQGLAEPGVVRAHAGPGDDALKLGGKDGVLSKAGFSIDEARTVLAKTLGVKPSKLKKAVVSRAEAEDLIRLVKKYDSPKPVGEIMQLADAFLNITKGMFTTPWPAFSVRNLVSGQLDNYIEGLWSRTSAMGAHKIMRGGEMAGAKDIPVIQRIAAQRGITNLADKEATDIIGDLAYAHKIVGRYTGEYAAVQGKAASHVQSSDMVHELLGPGRAHAQPGKTFKRYFGATPDTTLNPVKAKMRGGFSGATESTFGPMAGGQDIGHYVEGLNRLSPFIEQLRRGVDPAQAAQRVGKIQVEYGSRHFTKTEEQVLKRLIPFYSFTSRKIPWVAKTLGERPGGGMAQLIRAMNTAREPNALTPDYVAEQASIPTAGTPLEYLLGKPKEAGTDRYLTGFGLSLEDPLSFLGGSGMRGVFQEIGSRANPLLKGPVEWATGTSLFQKGPLGGRPLDEMDPGLGRTVANVQQMFGAAPVKHAKPVVGDWFEHLAANSPLSRVISTVRTATDQRKGGAAKAANLLTGFRITDVSPASKDAILRENIDAIMRETGASSYEQVRFTKAQIAEAETTDPAMATFMKQTNAIKNRLAKRTKERAAAKK